MFDELVGGLVPRRGFGGAGLEEEFYGVGGGGKCGWEITLCMHVCRNICMYEGKKVQRWTLVVSDTYTVQYITHSTYQVGYRNL